MVTSNQLRTTLSKPATQFDINRCMDCIANVTVQINGSISGCTDGPRTRCGLYQISWGDHKYTRFEEKLTHRPCARDRNCSKRLIEAKQDRCSSDPCLGHARDSFLPENSECDNYSATPNFHKFMTCYIFTSSNPTDDTRRTADNPIAITRSYLRLNMESATEVTVKPSNVMSTKQYVAFYGLTSLLAIILLFVILYIFRGCSCCRNPEALNCATSIDMRTLHQGNNRYEDIIGNIPASNIVTRTPEPQVIFKHNLSNIKRLDGVPGIGQFGSICSAIYASESGITQKVAVKTLFNYDYNKFMKEAQIACLMDHPHVLKLLGILIEEDNLKLVFPYMERADLGNYLKSNKNRVPPLLLRSFCIEITSGMEYLASKNVVHRDLAARNCMVDANLHIKVADFGLSRKLIGRYHRMVNTSIIPQSSAPECYIPGGKINEKTDVWGFGVTCWEIFNDASIPPIMVQNDGSLIAVAPARKCPEKIYDLMLQCWSYDQDSRSSFSDINKYLRMLEYTDFFPRAHPQIFISEAYQNNDSEGEKNNKLVNYISDMRGYLPHLDDEQNSPF